MSQNRKNVLLQGNGRFSRIRVFILFNVELRNICDGTSINLFSYQIIDTY
jgi:hypothetical protein